MTEVAFHFNAPDRVTYACRLLRKALGTGAKLVVVGDAALIAQLDVALWTFAPLEFVPHCRIDAEPSICQLTPVLLGTPDQLSGELPHQQVLVNLGDELPLGFERFDRVIEVVTMRDEERIAARGRWKHYSERGYKIDRYDIASKVTA